MSMFMEHMHATGEATWCDWCLNEGEMSASLMPLHNRFCLVTSLSCRVAKGSLTASTAQLHSGTGQLSLVHLVLNNLRTICVASLDKDKLLLLAETTKFKCT